jgi:hypothetical protein
MAGQGMPGSIGYMTNNNMMDPAQAANQMAYGNNTNPYVKSNVDSALQQLSNNFATNTLPGLRRQAIGDNSYGSSRNEMQEAQAGGDLSKQMYDTASQMYGNAYNTNQQNSLNSLGQIAGQQSQQSGLANQLFGAGNLQNLNAQQIGLTNYNNALNGPLAMLNAQGQAGLQQQQQYQQQLDNASNAWNFGQNAPWNQVQMFKNMTDPSTVLGGSGTGQTYQQQPIQQVNTPALVTSGLLGGAGLAASFAK